MNRSVELQRNLPQSICALYMIIQARCSNPFCLLACPMSTKCNELFILKNFHNLLVLQTNFIFNHAFHGRSSANNIATHTYPHWLHIFCYKTGIEKSGLKVLKSRSRPLLQSSHKTNFPYKKSKNAASRKASKTHSESVQNLWDTFRDIAESIRQIGTFPVQPY